MKDAPHDDSGLPHARVMLFDEDGSGGDILQATWETLPWGLHGDVCYAVTLQTGHGLHI